MRSTYIHKPTDLEVKNALKTLLDGVCKKVECVGEKKPQKNPHTGQGEYGIEID